MYLEISQDMKIYQSYIVQSGPAQLRILDLRQSVLKIGATSGSHIRAKNERIPKRKVALES